MRCAADAPELKMSISSGWMGGRGPPLLVERGLVMGRTEVCTGASEVA